VRTQGRERVLTPHVVGDVDVAAAAEHVAAKLGPVPRVAVILGSGSSHLADALEDTVSLPFESVPGFPASGVAGHAGRWVAGSLAGTRVLLQAGRYHAYEGHAQALVVAPVRVMARLGVRALVLTNAAGGIHPTIHPGDLVLIDDHVGLMFRNALAGPVAPEEHRFPDMSAPYDRELQRLAAELADAHAIPLRRGVYAAVLGPQYETSAEIRMLARMGADVVGMSTVPEVVTARALAVRCLAFSIVTNKATGLSPGRLSHDDVLEVGKGAGSRLARLAAALIPALDAAVRSERSD